MKTTKPNLALLLLLTPLSLPAQATVVEFIGSDPADWTITDPYNRVTTTLLPTPGGGIDVDVAAGNNTHGMAMIYDPIVFPDAQDGDVFHLGGSYVAPGVVLSHVFISSGFTVGVVMDLENSAASVFVGNGAFSGDSAQEFSSSLGPVNPVGQTIVYSFDFQMLNATDASVTGSLSIDGITYIDLVTPVTLAAFNQENSLVQASFGYDPDASIRSLFGYLNFDSSGAGQGSIASNTSSIVWSQTAVPEPSGFLLSGVGALLALRRRRPTRPIQG